MTKNNSNNSQSPRKIAKKRFKTFKKKINKACKLPNLENSDKDTILSFCGYGDPCEEILASNMPLRWEAAQALRNAMIEHRKNRSSNDREYYLGTFIDDSGITSDRVPLVRQRELRDKTYRVLKTAGLHAIGVIEAHPLMNYPGGGDGRSLLFHVHFIAWSDNVLSPGDLEKSVNNSRGWSCQLGASPAKIQALPPKKKDLSQVSYYLLKPPHSAKNRMAANDNPDAFRLMDTIKGYRPELALRVIEAYSQIDLRDTIFGVNEGADIRQKVREEITKFHSEALKSGSPIPKSFDIWLYWYNLRQRFGSDNFLPFRFQGNSVFPSPAKSRPSRHRRRPGNNQRRLAKRRVKKLSRRPL